MQYKPTFDDCLAYLNQQIQTLPPGLQKACHTVVDDPFFQHGYGSAGKHHGYAGGLLVHTAEVLRYALHMAQLFRDVDLTAITTAAIFHDYMKINEYIPEKPGTDVYSDGEKTKFAKSDYRYMVRHVAGSYAQYIRMTYGLNIRKETDLKIQHAMLAHHGRQEWGSPVIPQCVEALILHQADMLSCDYGETR
jgi:3'-5' exoribonuclease